MTHKAQCEQCACTIDLHDAQYSVRYYKWFCDWDCERAFVPGVNFSVMFRSPEPKETNIIHLHPTPEVQEEISQAASQ